MSVKLIRKTITIPVFYSTAIKIIKSKCYSVMFKYSVFSLKSLYTGLAFPHKHRTVVKFILSQTQIPGQFENFKKWIKL